MTKPRRFVASARQKLASLFARDKRKAVTGLLLVAVAFSLAYCQSARKNVELYGTIDYPPLRGGRDQVDFNIMAFTLMSESFPGKIYNDEMRAPFVRFAATHSGDLPPADEWQLGFFQRVPKKPQLASYHYRPWLYPLILGAAYKTLGYEFSVGRRVNVVIYGACAAIVCGVLFFCVSPMSALFGVVFLMLVTGLARRTTAFLAEPSQALALCLLFASLALFTRRPKSIWAAIAVGVCLGICMLAKQMFAPLSVLVIASLAVAGVVSRVGGTLRATAAMVLGAGLIAGPWVAYNVTGTKDATLLLGTSGWHDMPAAYDVRAVNAREINSVREILFREYQEKHGVRIRGHVERARYGRKIFMENLRSGTYNEVFWQRFFFKLGDELRAKRLEWVLRAVALLGFLFLNFRVGASLAALIFGSVLFFALFRSTSGRTFDAFWPLIASLAALPLSAVLKASMAHWRPSIVSESRWSSISHWLNTPALEERSIWRSPSLGRFSRALARRFRRPRAADDG